MKRHQKWMRAGARRNVGARHAKRRCALQPGSLTAGVRKAQETARQGRRDRNGRSKPAVDVATEGWKPAAPEGPGRDSAAGPVRSMTAPVPAREVARGHRKQTGNISSRKKSHRKRKERHIRQQSENTADRQPDHKENEQTRMEGGGAKRSPLQRRRRAAFSGVARRGHPPPPGSLCPSDLNSEQDG